MSIINWFGAVRNYLAPQEVGTTRDQRLWNYGLWHAYHNGTVYLPTRDGGYRDVINQFLEGAKVNDFTPLYNPIPEVVGIYQHVFGGSFGNDIRIETQNEALREAIEQIWVWSNINVQKQNLCRLAALYGNVGIRIVVENNPDLTKRKVWLSFEPPAHIADVDLDPQGNVQEVILEYDHTVGVGDDAECIRIREYQDREMFATYQMKSGIETPYDMVNETPGGAQSSYPNLLGFPSFVLLHHTPTTGKWGATPFTHTLFAIDRINALLCHIDTQIHRHVRATWLIAASGKAPVEIDLSGQKVAYVDTSLSAGTMPVMQPMIAPLNIADARAFAEQLINWVENQLPELRAVQGKYLSGQSGDTIAQLRKPAEERIALARTNYEDALKRALQIALSWGITLELWDIGSGVGIDAATKAYKEGLEEFSFNTRELLPLTSQERNLVAQGLGDDVSWQERLRVRGYSDEQIALIQEEKTVNQTRQRDTFAGMLSQAERDFNAGADTGLDAGVVTSRPQPNRDEGTDE